MKAPELTIPCEISSGIHLAKILYYVEKMSQLNSYVLVETSETTVNAKSLLGMSILAASLSGRSQAVLRASGPDAEKALKDLELLLQEG